VIGRLLRRAAVLAAALGLGVLIGAAPASAHDVLISSSPANGSSGPAPSMIMFTFNDVVLNNFAALVITGPNGKHYEDGTPRVIDTSVSVRVKPLESTGAYTTSYRIVSADGHPVSGDIKFTVTTTKPGTIDPNMPGVPASSAPVTGGGGSVTPYVIGGGIAILVLALGAVVLATRRRDSAAGEVVDDDPEADGDGVPDGDDPPDPDPADPDPAATDPPDADLPEGDPSDADWSDGDPPDAERSEGGGKHSAEAGGDSAGSAHTGRTAE
jgi:methionine-rich copper-binding protein CopC